MLLNKSMAEILAEMKKIAETGLDVREGSFTDHVLRAAALEIANDYFDQNRIIPIAFVNETSGKYIDMRANEYGITRKGGERAHATVTFKGSAGKTIPKNTTVVTAAGLRFTTDISATIETGLVIVPVTAADVGTEYNVPMNAIVSLQSGGTVSVYGSTAAEGGTNGETDAELLARLIDKWRRPATSGNANEYRAWALSCDGVGAALVQPLWAGPGTVRVLITDMERQAATTELCNEVKRFIETVRPIGASVNVASATVQQINVTANVTLEAGVELSAIKAAYEDELQDYFEETTLEETQKIRYNQVWYLLMNIQGVLDATNVKVNGGVTDITVSSGSIATRGTVTLNAAN